jgi:hypothetical protein
MRHINTKVTDYFLSIIRDEFEQKILENNDGSGWYSENLTFSFYKNKYEIEVSGYAKITCKKAIEYLNTGLGEMSFDLGDDCYIVDLDFDIENIDFYYE